MTNKERLEQLNNQIDNGDVGLLQHFDLVLNVLPQINFMAKYWPNIEYKESRSQFELDAIEQREITKNL